MKKKRLKMEKENETKWNDWNYRQSLYWMG
jgi:hypothetical protein